VTCNNCSVNGLETFRAKSVEISSMAMYNHNAYTKVMVKAFGKWWNSYNYVHLAPYLCWIWVTKM